MDLYTRLHDGNDEWVSSSRMITTVLFMHHNINTNGLLQMDKYAEVYQ